MAWLRLLRWSERLHGPDPIGASAWPSATSPPATWPPPWTRRPPRLSLDPGFLLAGEFGTWLTSEGRTAAGVDPIEWGNALAVTDKVDGYRAFSS